MSDYAISGDYGDQLFLPGLGPISGDRYVNKGTGVIVTVLRLHKGRRTWVTLRYNGRERVITIEEFEAFYRKL
jgi:hypothetical protein